MTAREWIFVALVVATAASGVGVALFAVHHPTGFDRPFAQVR